MSVGLCACKTAHLTIVFLSLSLLVCVYACTEPRTMGVLAHRGFSHVLLEAFMRSREDLQELVKK